MNSAEWFVWTENLQPLGHAWDWLDAHALHQVMFYTNKHNYKLVACSKCRSDERSDKR